MRCRKASPPKGGQARFRQYLRTDKPTFGNIFVAEMRLPLSATSVSAKGQTKPLIITKIKG